MIHLFKIKTNPLVLQADSGGSRNAAWIFLSSIIAIIVLFILVLSTGIFNTNVSEISGLTYYNAYVWCCLYYILIFVFCFYNTSFMIRETKWLVIILVIVPLINLFL